MVKIAPLTPYLPVNPQEFTTNPYDVIDEDEEKQLKKNPNSLIHLILPDGEGEEQYVNAAKALDTFIDNKIIIKVDKPAIYVYRQESEKFSQQGFIMGASLEDYENNNIVKHEHTREKPLKDRMKHISATNVAAGLVWNVFQADSALNEVMEKIKEKPPKFEFTHYGYKQILWEEIDEKIIKKLIQLFNSKKLFIADGHHRAASANEYRKLAIEKGFPDSVEGKEAPWKYLLTYVASDDQVRIFPYNRVVKKLPMSANDFIKQLEDVYSVEKVEEAFNPSKKHEVSLCCQGIWYKLLVKDTNFASKRDSLDVAILQDKVLDPILGIQDPRASDNLFFKGGIEDPKEMEKFVTEKGNDLFINLYPVDIRDLEEIAEAGGVMPPKSTWFDPKVLSGLVLHKLK